MAADGGVYAMADDRPAPGASGAGQPVAHIGTIAFQGIDVVPVDVQVQMGAGMPTFTIVGVV